MPFMNIVLILKQVHMPLLPDNRIVDKTQLSFVEKSGSSFEIKVDVNFIFFLFYFADVLRVN